ncbi:MAG: c-type cytochrome [Actinobacteria bacterium]|nr:MAG: c-type cytochrome [Actinomycetota bacterium]
MTLSRLRARALGRPGRRVIWALAATVALGGGVAEAQPPIGIVRPAHEQGQPLSLLGRELYAGNCASCHGIDGRGVGSLAPQRGVGAVKGLGPSLRGVGALAADFYLRTGRMPLERSGKQASRQGPQFNEREIEALVAYVASLGQGPPVPQPHPERGSVAAGLHLFTEHCAGCHQVAGEGGVLTGARVPLVKHSSPAQIAEAVRIGPFLMPRFSRRQISDRQLDSIIAYVRLADAPVDRGGWGIGHLGPIPEGMVTWLIAVVLLVGVCVLLGRRLS